MQLNQQEFPHWSSTVRSMMKMLWYRVWLIEVDGHFHRSCNGIDSMTIIRNRSLVNSIIILYILMRLIVINTVCSSTVHWISFVFNWMTMTPLNVDWSSSIAVYWISKRNILLFIVSTVILFRSRFVSTPFLFVVEKPRFVNQSNPLQIVPHYSTVTFVCHIYGVPVPTVTWYRLIDRDNPQLFLNNSPM